MVISKALKSALLGSIFTLLTQGVVYGEEIESNKIVEHRDIVLMSHNKPVNKLANAGIVLDGEIVGTVHTIIWFYGPNPMLSKEDYNVIVYGGGNTLFKNLGLKYQLVPFFKRISGVDSFDIEKRSRELGFDSFQDMFEVVYDRYTNDSDIEFKLFADSLDSLGVSADTYSPKYIHDIFFAPYIAYGDSEGRLYLDSSIIVTSENDFSAYASVFSICKDILEKNIERGDIYGL